MSGLTPLLTELFYNLNSKLTSNTAIDTKNSGSTGILILSCKSTVVCASVGDSQMYVYKKDSLKDNNLAYQELTVVHSPEDSHETSRIINKGGSVRRAANQQGDLVGPLRVFKGSSRIPGLMMTRSFGDEIGHSVGMTCRPSTTYLTQASYAQTSTAAI